MVPTIEQKSATKKCNEKHNMERLTESSNESLQPPPIFLMKTRKAGLQIFDATSAVVAAGSHVVSANTYHGTRTDKSNPDVAAASYLANRTCSTTHPSATPL